MAFDYRTIRRSDNFWPFKYQTSPVFRSPLYLNFSEFEEVTDFEICRLLPILMVCIWHFITLAKFDASYGHQATLDPSMNYRSLDNWTNLYHLNTVSPKFRSLPYHILILCVTHYVSIDSLSANSYHLLFHLIKSFLHTVDHLTSLITLANYIT